jgi:hypothetical protein
VVEPLPHVGEAEDLISSTAQKEKKENEKTPKWNRKKMFTNHNSDKRFLFRMYFFKFI